MEETQNTKSEEGLDAQMDVSSLYREQTFTDRKVGIITTLTPVLPDGSDDKSRSVIYSGEAHIMTQMGSLPISFEIKASSLEEAVKNYGTAAKEAVEKTVQELQELRRQAASKLVVPGQPGFTPPPTGGAGGSGLVMP